MFIKKGLVIRKPNFFVLGLGNRYGGFRNLNDFVCWGYKCSSVEGRVTAIKVHGMYNFVSFQNI